MVQEVRIWHDRGNVIDTEPEKDRHYGPLLQLVKSDMIIAYDMIIIKHHRAIFELF